MHALQETTPRVRSAFAASFLSLLFPGLGHAYGGAWQRAIAFAAAPLLLVSLAAGLALNLRLELLGFALQPWMLIAILVLDVVALGYRIVAAVDAYRVAAFLNAAEASGDGRLGRPRRQLGALSVAGLVAVLLVMAIGHAAVAYYDIAAYDFVNCVFDPSGQASCDSAPGADAAAAASSAAASGDASGTMVSPGATATGAPSASAAASAAALPAWNGKDRLNILLVGADQRPAENSFNTDTMIVVSIDPTTHQVGMFQVPRDTVDVPLPPGPAQAVFGTAYRGKINSLWMTATGRGDLFPGSVAARGPNALKATLGYLYGLDIRWYVMVNFDGFRKIVDTLGGVTINVQLPVMDDNYPGEKGRPTRVYIPAGVQHMTGSQALVYARSRHGSNDFDRGARQQRVLLSIKDQTDFSTALSRMTELLAALKSAVRTDIPVAELPRLVSLASKVNSANIRSFVFAPPVYQKEVASGDPRGYIIQPDVDKIRAAVEAAFTVDAATLANRDRIAAERATVSVLNGSGRSGQAAVVAAYLDYVGVNATAPNVPPRPKSAKTRLVVYNGAEARLPETLKVLAGVLGVPYTTKVDPAVTVDIVVTTSTTTPKLTVPAGP